MLAREGPRTYRVAIGGQSFEGRIEKLPGEGTLYRSFVAEGRRTARNRRGSRGSLQLDFEGARLRAARYGAAPLPTGWKRNGGVIRDWVQIPRTSNPNARAASPRALSWVAIVGSGPMRSRQISAVAR